MHTEGGEARSTLEEKSALDGLLEKSITEPLKRTSSRNMTLTGHLHSTFAIQRSRAL